MFALVLLAAVYLAMFISQPFITLFHEMGHAVAYLILTKPDKIDIYIGSYGKAKQSYRVKIGKLQVYVKKSFPFIRGGGYCQSYAYEENYINRIIILSAGPLASVLIAIILGWIAITFNLHGSIKMLCFILIIFSVISLIRNIVPSKISLNDGRYIGNDGKQILFTIKIRKVYKDYVLALNHLKKSEFEPAIDILKSLLVATQNDANIVWLLIWVLMDRTRYDEASELFNVLKQPEFDAQYYTTMGTLQSFTKKSEAAIENYKSALRLSKNNLVVLNNLGYELVNQGNHRQGDSLLEKAIKLSPGFSHPYSNLGYSYILQGKLEQGKAMLDKSMALQDNDAYAYKYLGIYYLKKQDARQAILYFNKALELKKDIEVASYINDAERLLKQPADM